MSLVFFKKKEREREERKRQKSMLQQGTMEMNGAGFGGFKKRNGKDIIIEKHQLNSSVKTYVIWAVIFAVIFWFIFSAFHCHGDKVVKLELRQKRIILWVLKHKYINVCELAFYCKVPYCNPEFSFFFYYYLKKRHYVTNDFMKP